ncbi:MAG TPA: hypothetical protein VE291_01275 [Terracidiphilus sp.]|jgi:hypothetical protein|nr:hypothetical protein [Terracidiphilus sp.]
MKITIQGTDYTAALDAEKPLTIERTLNEPSVCQLWLSLPASGSLAMPVRNQAIAITGDDGTVYFTGYLAVTPLPEYAGMALEGPRYRIALVAVSDELLLDQAGIAPAAATANTTAGALVTTLVTRTGITALSTAGLTLATTVGSFAPEPGANWSTLAGRAANDARAAYRAINGALQLTAVPGAVHALNETDGSLNLASLTLTAAVKRALANDITVCGENEPAAYVTEYFLGDGVTTTFDLSETPFFLTASKSTLIAEPFTAAAFNPAVWTAPSGYMTPGASGLTMSGGSGVDGQVRLSSLNRFEMGGTLLLEATGVTLANGSNGILPGFFVGDRSLETCEAGFRATAAEGTGAVSLQPVVQGALVGSSYATNPDNQYALRVRVHCNEMQRDLSLYQAVGDSGAIALGGQTNTLGAAVLFELQEFVDGVAGTPVVLYDGAIAALPDSCWVVAANSLSLTGTMRALNLTNLGSGWVTSTPAGGAPFTRRLGTTAQGAECHVERTARLAFYTGFTPPVGERITVTYRGVSRAVGRAVNAASQAALAAAGLPPVSAWIGTVTNPAARSSQDCRNAAQTLAQAAASVSALWSGTYKGPRSSFAADVWPGDALALNAPSASLNAQVVVRRVKVSYAPSYPDLVSYEIAFANDWANDLSIKTSASVPANTGLPAVANPTFAANLNALVLASLSGTTVTINTNATAPSGGGFEVRLRDYAFKPGEDTDLVIRAATATLSFTRVAASDRYYVRMYDGATPPNYSEFSAALILNLPLGS